MESFAKTIELRKNTFKSYVSRLWMNNQFKSILIDDYFINNNPPFYLFYTELFSSLFDQSAGIVEATEKLNIAGYLYYISIMEVDTLIDEIRPGELKQKEKHFLPLISSICQEESVKILSSLYPIQSNFWKIWNGRRDEYIQAIILDKKNPEVITLAEFEDLADKKSAFGKVSIDSLFLLFGANKDELYKRVLLSHKYFSVGFQILDDILDMERDLRNPQVNFACVTLLADLKAQGIQADITNHSTFRKCLYIYGTAEKLLTLAIQYLNKSLFVISGDNLPMWSTVITRQLREVRSFASNLTAYNKLILADLRLSRIKNSTVQSLEGCTTLAREYIVKYQGTDGSWEDYCNNAGLSNVWSTAFILSHISSLSDPFDAICLDKGSAFLLSNKRENMWGYNTNWIWDTDSTTMALFALKENGFENPEEYSLWKALQHPNGGMSTYMDGEKLQRLFDSEFDDLTGWLQSHPCVSALAYYFLCKSDPKCTQREKLEKYLFSCQNDDGLLESYWWTSSIYATSFFWQGYFFDQAATLTESIKLSFASMLTLQNPNGSFKNNDGFESPFFTALAISAFCSSPIVFSNNMKQVRNAVEWLMKNQYTDGSFDCTYSLQIPRPDVTDTRIVAEWSKSSKYSTNVVVKDFMRLFTTSAVLKAFDDYKKSELTSFKSQENDRS